MVYSNLTIHYMDALSHVSSVIGTSTLVHSTITIATDVYSSSTWSPTDLIILAAVIAVVSNCTLGIRAVTERTEDR